MSSYEQYIPKTKSLIKIALLGDNSKYTFIESLKNCKLYDDKGYMKNSVEINVHSCENYRVQFFIIGECITQQIKDSYMKMSQIHITFLENNTLYVDYLGKTERLQMNIDEPAGIVLNNIVSNYLCESQDVVEEKVVKPDGLLKLRLNVWKTLKSIWCHQ